MQTMREVSAYWGSPSLATVTHHERGALIFGIFPVPVLDSQGSDSLYSTKNQRKNKPRPSLPKIKRKTKRVSSIELLDWPVVQIWVTSYRKGKAEPHYIISIWLWTKKLFFMHMTLAFMGLVYKNSGATVYLWVQLISVLFPCWNESKKKQQEVNIRRNQLYEIIKQRVSGNGM